MPKQNRVTPFGGLIAIECRGTLVGNCGYLHDDRQRIRRAFACKRWLVCVLEFRVLTPRSIVRALAAGYPVEVHPSARRASGHCSARSAGGQR